MTFQGDPFRTLGITPGASLNEIRSAYRRLVKQFHPDAAGERALPRFLAIQAAYERLVDAEGRLRTRRPGDSRTAGTPGSRPADPWQADPSRAEASRQAWRARRAAGAAGDAHQDGAPNARRDRSAGSDAAGTPGGGAGSRGGSRRGGSRTGAETPGAPDHREAPRERRRREPRGPRKATPGSTTYDEAKETPLDPDWDGSSWYGPTSRTFWTINPREYADPRKHGPEYQARARRFADAPEDEDEESAPGEGSAAGGVGATFRWQAGTGGSTADDAPEWGTRRWSWDRADSGDDADRGRADERAGADPSWARAEGGDRRGAGGPPPFDRSRGTTWPPRDPVPGPDLEALVRRASPASLRALAARRDPRIRIALALLAWPPIGYAVGTLIGMLTGCGSYAASCREPQQLLPILAQPLVLALLAAVPALAAVGAFASLVALAIALPVATVLSVGTPPESRIGAPALGVVVTIGYAVAFVLGALGGHAPAGGDPATPLEPPPAGGLR